MSSEAALKAWATRRARAAAEKAACMAAPIVAPPRRKPRQLVERISALAPARAEMTAGQKAAASRRAMEIARAEVAAQRAGVDQPSALADCQTVRMWVDDPKVGCGVRNFVVLHIGRQTVRLFNAPTLREIEVDRRAFDKHAKPYASKAGSLARIIDATATSYDRLGLDYAPRLVRAAREAVAC